MHASVLSPPLRCAADLGISPSFSASIQLAASLAPAYAEGLVEAYSQLQLEVPPGTAVEYKVGFSGAGLKNLVGSSVGGAALGRSKKPAML